jgi:3-oxoacyl-[acyl-carrier protein] reductase
MNLGLTGRRALITGATKGIGRAIAETLASEGCALAICARTAEAVDSAAANLRSKGVEVFALPVDVTDPCALRDFTKAAADALGGIDIVVSNASAGSLRGDDSWVQSTAADLQAFAVLAEAALPHLRASPGGAVVAMCSTSALDTDFPSGPTSFAAVKAAVLHHAAALSRAWAPHGVRVNAISPGPVLIDGGAWDQVQRERPEVFERVRSTIPLGRLGTAQDIADAVGFLVSDRAAFCTGINLVVDGGMLSRVQH